MLSYRWDLLIRKLYWFSPRNTVQRAGGCSKRITSLSVTTTFHCLYRLECFLSFKGLHYTAQQRIPKQTTKAASMFIIFSRHFRKIAEAARVILVKHVTSLAFRALWKFALSDTFFGRKFSHSSNLFSSQLLELLYFVEIGFVCMKDLYHSFNTHCSLLLLFSDVCAVSAKSVSYIMLSRPRPVDSKLFWVRLLEDSEVGLAVAPSLIEIPLPQ